ncbi:MAG: OsmC family protein [Flavobacteriales bacterium]
MTHTVQTQYMDQFHFDAKLNEHTIKMDGSKEQLHGVSPKPLLLSALAGCAGMDVVSILKKREIDFEDFSIEVRGDLTRQEPRIYELIHIVFSIRMMTDMLHEMDAAVKLSFESYCGVYAMLSKASRITYEVVLKE